MSVQDERAKIAYPFMHPKGFIAYVDITHPHMSRAKAYARKASLDESMPNGLLLVKDGQIIGRGANGSVYHKTHPCERVRLSMSTGQGYELCEGCHPKNHSEPKAIQDALQNGHNPEGAEAFLWGHWWCCEPCWNVLIENGVTKVYLLQDSEHLFNRASPHNIIGKQFA